MEKLNISFDLPAISPKEINLINPQSLAFVGDAVYTLFVRSFFCETDKVKSRVLHKKVIDFVKASAQSQALDNIYDSLNEEEIDIVKRARNTKVNSMAKNAKMIEYKKSTGFEALLGFLYLSNKKDRLNQILHMAVGGFGGHNDNWR